MSQTPLQNPSAERSVIASVLHQPRLMDDVLLVVKPEQFFDETLGVILKEMNGLASAGLPTTVVSVAERLIGKHSVPGGIDVFLLGLMNEIPHGEHAVYHAKLVRAAWQRRSAMFAVEAMRTAIGDGSANFDEALGLCESQLQTLQETTAGKFELDIGTLLVSAIDERERCKQGLKTAFDTLDSMTTGIHGGQLIIIGARTTVGKSAFALNIITNMIERGDGALLVTLEMSKTDVLYRLIARVSGLRMYQIRSSDVQYHAPILDASNQMTRWPLFIDDLVPQTVSQIASRARMLKRKNKIKLVVVDYLQLITPDDRRAPREQQISAISRGLRLMARQLDIPVIALSQLNRGLESRANRTPQLSDIRESGAIEQDADGVWLLHRPAMSEDTKDANDAKLIIAKNRQGPTGQIDLEWDGARFLFREKPDEYSSRF